MPDNTLQPLVKNNLSVTVKISLIKYIRKLDYKKNPKLPSEIEISKILNVSRATLRRTLDELEQDGIIIRIHGKGTFVNPEAMQIKLNLNPGYEFRKLIQVSGYKADVKVIRFEVVNATEKVSKALHINLNDSIYILEKVYFADGHPAIISIDRFPCYLFNQQENFKLKDGKESIFDILRKKAGRIITRDKIEIESLTCDEILNYSSYGKNMECSSCLVFHGINFDQDNIPIIYDTEFYNTSYIKFNTIRLKDLFNEY